jgi:hypothetical protein
MRMKKLFITMTTGLLALSFFAFNTPYLQAEKEAIPPAMGNREDLSVWKKPLGWSINSVRVVMVRPAYISRPRPGWNIKRH